MRLNELLLCQCDSFNDYIFPVENNLKKIISRYRRLESKLLFSNIINSELFEWCRSLLKHAIDAIENVIQLIESNQTDGEKFRSKATLIISVEWRQ